MTTRNRRGPYGPRWRHGGFEGGKEQHLHYVWRSMLSRCYRTNDDSYCRYGALGVSVAPEWHSYPAFAASVGARPFPGASLDRIDPFGNYEPGNVRWATPAMQARNKRAVKLWYEPSSQEAAPMVDWAARLGISKELAHWRMKTWGTFEKGRTWLLQRTP